MAFARASRPIHPGTRILNYLSQRILRINSQYPWQIHFSSRVQGRVTIGKDVWKSFAGSGGCYVQGNNGVEIGDGTIFAPGVKIISANHDLENGGWVPDEPIVIGKNCWLGANAVILPGVKLGDNCVVGAGAVVTKSFGPGQTLTGVPARPIPAGQELSIQ